MSLRTHAEKIIYIVIGSLIAITAGVIKERFFDSPEFGLEGRICAPVVKIKAELVNVETKEVIPIPNPEDVIPVWAQFTNVGKKPLENLEIVLEFHAPGGTRVTNHRYATKPERGFGKVEILEDAPNRSKIRIALLNPRDELYYSAIGSRPVTILVYAKFPGLSFYQVQPPGCR